MPELISMGPTLSALNPVLTIGEQVAEPLTVRGMSRRKAHARAVEMLDQLHVALDGERRVLAERMERREEDAERQAAMGHDEDSVLIAPSLWAYRPVAKPRRPWHFPGHRKKRGNRHAFTR